MLLLCYMQKNIRWTLKKDENNILKMYITMKIYLFGPS